MARISIRIFKDETELARIDAGDLQAAPTEIAAACRQLVEDWVAASRPPTEEESAAFEEAFARQFGVPRQSRDERIRGEQALAERMIEDRRRAEAELKERNDR
jgi:hypothetical protein